MNRNLRKIGIALLSTMILGVFSGCGNDASKTASSTSGKSGSPLRYTLGTSSTGGNFYLVGGGIATLLNNTLKDSVVVTAEETGGSTANLTMIQNGEADLGIAMTSSLYEGLQGKAKWTKGKPIDKVRGLAPLYPSYLTMYSLKCI